MKVWPRHGVASLSVVERDALTFTCPFCNARPSAWCLTGLGQVSPTLHPQRYELGALR